MRQDDLPILMMCVAFIVHSELMTHCQYVKYNQWKYFRSAIEL